MRRNRLALLVVAASALAVGLPLAAPAQEGSPSPSTAAEPLPESIPRAPAGVCIRPDARQNVERCPQGAPPPNKRAGARPTGPGSSVASHFSETKRLAEERGEGITGPSITIDESTRRNRAAAQARALNLLQREVQVLERLVGRTRAGDPRGADYLLRLAETYFELQTYYNTAARELDQPLFEARQSKNAGRVQQIRQQQQQAEQQLNRFREEAIRTYARLVRDYPNYGRMDEVLFSLAFGLEEMRQYQRARQVYHRLIKGYPQSRFIPHAYLSFAEFYFGEGDMRAAQQFYNKVTEIPPDRNPVYGYALYKQAWALYNLEDFRGALTQFVRVVEFATQNPDARDAANLARQSRRELVLPYSRVGRPNQALEFFRRYATNEDQALEMLERLAELYFDTGNWPQTIEVYHRLIAERPQGDRVCYYQSRVTNAVISSRPKDDQVREVRRLVDLYGTFTAAQHPTEAINECKQATASVLVYLATAWHREAIGTDDQPGTNDRNTMRAAAALYRLVTERFPDMEEMEFPDIDRRDWPTLYRISYFYAELLWRMEDWATCGPAFDRVVELNPQGEFTQDAAYAAVLCYNSLYQQEYQSRERQTREGQADGGGRGGRGGRRGGRRPQQEAAPTGAAQYAPRELNQTENGMLNAFSRFVCYVADSEELPTIKYRRARIFYESNRYEEAALLFRDIAWNHRDSDLAEYAANLYLDSLNILGTQWQRSQCIADIRESIDPLAGFYCSTPAQRDAHPDLCQVVEQLRCDTLRLTAEAAQRERRFTDAAQTYVTIAREHRECGRLDEVLYNAALNYEAARLLGRAIRVRTILITNFPESQLARRAIYLVGANYHALAIYNQAAEWYERFARQFPGEDGSACTEEQRSTNTCPIAHDALQNAVFFRLGLGQVDEALEDARLFERNYRTRMPRETSQVIFSLGSIYERANDWNRVFSHYNSWLRTYGRRGLPHEVIRANVQMGRAQWELERRDDARRHFEAATREWQRDAGERISQLEGASDEDRALYLVRAKDATSEALFYLAETQYAAFRAIRFPRFTGGRSLERVQRWAERDFAQWLNEKRAALVRAEEAYNLIAQLEVPQWRIAAAARVGEMYRSFMEQIREAPIPEEIENDDELYGIYVDALEGAARPLQQTAMERFESCLNTATQVRWFNQYSQQCERELNALDAARFPMAAELRGEANYVERQLARPGAVSLQAQGDEGLGTAEASEDSSIPEAGAGQ